jgi:hypothetical protein
MHEEGKYHYGITGRPMPKLGPLFQVDIVGNCPLPEAPKDGIATPEENEAWFARLRENGYTVTVTPVDEGRFAEEE